MRILHRKAVVPIHFAHWRFRIKCKTPFQSVLELGFLNFKRRVFLNLVRRVPLHAQKSFHRVSAALLADLVHLSAQID